jgi:hypothetical protein
MGPALSPGPPALCLPALCLPALCLPALCLPALCLPALCLPALCLPALCPALPAAYPALPARCRPARCLPVRSQQPSPPRASCSWSSSICCLPSAMPSCASIVMPSKPLPRANWSSMRSCGNSWRLSRSCPRNERCSSACAKRPSPISCYSLMHVRACKACSRCSLPAMHPDTALPARRTPALHRHPWRSTSAAEPRDGRPARRSTRCSRARRSLVVRVVDVSTRLARWHALGWVSCLHGAPREAWGIVRAAPTGSDRRAHRWDPRRRCPLQQFA